MPWYGSHKYLNEFIKENRCRKIMEVGVYNGENARNMVRAAAENTPPDEITYYGFDYFSHHSVARVSQKLKETGCRYTLIEGDTWETLPDAVEMLPKMDVIFIDAGKSYREAKNDWVYSAQLMHSGTGVYVHNVGFPGVGRMVDEVPRDRYMVETFYALAEGSVALIKKKG
jgi:predicted O-methyltransferase YrrM